MKVRKTENAQVNEILEYLGTAFSDDGLTLDYVEKPELNGLEIEKQGDRIIINYSQLSYLFRALGIAKENLDKGDFKIKERARFSLNGMMVDCSRNAVISIETLQDVIKQIALMGHNMLMLYTEDTYEIEGEPYFGYMRGRYTIKELNL